MVGLRHGHMGKVGPEHTGYIGTFRQLDGVEIVAYCEDTDPSLLEPVGQFDPDASTYTSIDDLIRNEEFELAVVVLPATEVPDAAIKLAEAGKHMYVEKQLARRSPELAELTRVVDRNGVVAMPGYPHRFNPVCRELKQLIDDGMLGRPLDVEVRLVTSQVRPGLRDPENFLFTDAGEGGGVLHMLGCHYLEVVRYLLGCEIKSVQAMTGRPVGFIDQPLEDIALVAMEYENGAYGSMHAGYLQSTRSEYDHTLIIRGTEGEAHWSPMGGPALLAKSTHDSWKEAPERTIYHRLEPGPSGYASSKWMFNWMQEFVNRARDGRETEITMRDALRVLQSIDAMYASAASGRRIMVDYTN